MTQPDRNRRTLRVLALVVAALAVLVTVWLLVPRDTAGPETPEVASTSESSTSTAPEDTEAVEETAPAGDSTADEEAASTEVETATAPEVPAPSERVPALVVSARVESGVTILTVDYIQFLTGEDAAAAAADRGDESPPPNDYYIVNDNTRLREFPVQDGIPVMTVVQDDGTSDPGGHTLSLADWLTRLSGPTGDAFKSSFYWLTVTGETITTIEQQYLP